MCMISSSKLYQEWVLDSGCTLIYVSIEHWFQSLKKFDGGLVLLGNDESCRVRGVGSVRIKMFG